MTTKQQILKEFDEFVEEKQWAWGDEDDDGNWHEDVNFDDIKSFFSSKIGLIEKQAKQQALKEVRDEIEKDLLFGNYQYVKGWNDRIEADIKLITNKLNQLK